MRNIEFLEKASRGTPSFPVQLYRLDHSHPRYIMPFHWHTEYEIIYINSGSISIKLNNITILAEKDDVIIIPDGTLHGGTPADCKYDCVVFDYKFLFSQNKNCVLKDIFFKNHTFDKNMIKNDSIRQTAKKIISNLTEERTDSNEIICTGLFMQLFGELIKNNCYQPVKNIKNNRTGYLKKALSYIQNHYAENISLQDLADFTGISQKYLCKEFLSLTSKTPIEYINEYRIECSCALLVSTNLSMLEITYNSGFNDQSYFIKMFKRFKQMTPSEYRKLYSHTNGTN